MHTKFSGKQGPDIDDVFQGEHKHYQLKHCKKWKRKMSYLSFLHPDILLNLFR